MRSSAGPPVVGEDFFDREIELRQLAARIPVIRPHHPIRKFNPGVFQRDEEVAEQFVVRLHEFDVLLDILRRNVGAPSCQHALVIGPRGTGKTMLLARVAAELRLNHELAGQLLPVRFMEESYEIVEIADFWLEVLRRLATERGVDPALAVELRAAHASLCADWRSEGIADRARATVLDAADRLGKRLVVMVENLHALNDDADEHFGWQLRQVLQTEPRLILLASATTRFKGMDPWAPFFEMFKVLGLDPLSLEECCRLWETLTDHAATRRQMRPLEILTGGNPRLLVMVAAFSRHRSMRRLLEEIVVLVDEHTDYFRSNLDALPKTERRVFAAALDLWRPATSGEVAAQARMDIRMASALLGRLERRGAVVVQPGVGRRRYVVAERLYCVYYRLRRGRNEADIVKHLIMFMANFYAKSDFGNMLNEGLASGDRLIEVGLKRALEEDPDIGNAAPEAAAATWMQTVRACSSSTDTHTRSRASRALLNLGHLSYNQGHRLRALAYSQQILAQYEAGESSEPREDVARAYYLSSRVYRRSGMLEEAIRLCEDMARHCEPANTVHLQECLAAALYEKGCLQAQVGRHADAAHTFDGLLQRCHVDSEADYSSVICRTLAKRAQSELLLGRFDNAIATCQRVLDACNADVSEGERKVLIDVLVVKGDAECWKRQSQLATDTSDRLEQGFGDAAGGGGIPAQWLARWIRARARGQNGDGEAVARDVRWLYERLNISNKNMVNEMLGRTYALLVEGVGPLDLLNVLSSDPAKVQALWPLEVALRILAGEPVRAPVEVLTVAEDIVEKVEEAKRAVSVR